MSSNQQVAIAYCWQDIARSLSEEDLDSPGSLSNQQRQVQQYLLKNPSMSLAQTFVESREEKQKQFPELEKALSAAKSQSACLVIACLGNLIRYEGVTNALLNSDIPFVCLDQPKVTKDTLPAVIEFAVESARQQRMLHSALIRRGLEEAVTKLGKRLGNPNAIKEITKVNKPKTESAIMFALVLAPIIATYRRKGFSQRKMVDCLNHEGFTAPEGGHWVLSQLQKVLERIELNNIALNAAEALEQFKASHYNDEQIIQGLNGIPIRSPGGGPWDAHKLSLVRERLELIHDIGDFNSFIAQVYPQIIELERLGKTADDIARAFNQQGIKVPDRVLWELSQENEGESVAQEAIDDTWDAHVVQVVEHIVDRRRKDMDTFLNPKTVAAAQEILDKATGSTNS